MKEKEIIYRSGLDTLVYCSGCVKHNEHTYDTDHSADNVVAIGSEMVYLPGPKKRQDDEDAAVSGIDPAEAGGLISGNNSVQSQENGPEYTVPDGAVLFEPEPDEVTATDLAQASQNE